MLYIVKLRKMEKELEALEDERGMKYGNVKHTDYFLKEEGELLLKIQSLKANIEIFKKMRIYYD